MNVSSKNDSRTKQNVVFVKQPGWWFQFRFESFSSGFRRGCIIAIVSLIFSENQSGQFGTWFVIIHLITYWFLNWGEPSINQPTSEKRASMKLIKDCEHSQPPTSATANQLCCVDCSTWIITLHWCNLEKTPRVYLIRWPWHAFQNIWTPSVSVCVCVCHQETGWIPLCWWNYPWSWVIVFRCFLQSSCGQAPQHLRPCGTNHSPVESANLFHPPWSRVWKDLDLCSKNHQKIVDSNGSETLQSTLCSCSMRFETEKGFENGLSTWSRGFSSWNCSCLHTQYHTIHKTNPTTSQLGNVKHSASSQSISFGMDSRLVATHWRFTGHIPSLSL